MAFITIIQHPLYSDLVKVSANDAKSSFLYTDLNPEKSDIADVKTMCDANGNETGLHIVMKSQPDFFLKPTNLWMLDVQARVAELVSSGITIEDAAKRAPFDVKPFAPVDSVNGETVETIGELRDEILRLKMTTIS